MKNKKGSGAEGFWIQHFWIIDLILFIYCWVSANVTMMRMEFVNTHDENIKSNFAHIKATCLPCETPYRDRIQCLCLLAWLIFGKFLLFLCFICIRTVIAPIQYCWKCCCVLKCRMVFVTVWHFDCDRSIIIEVVICCSPYFFFEKNIFSVQNSKWYVDKKRHKAIGCEKRWIKKIWRNWVGFAAKTCVHNYQYFITHHIHATYLMLKSTQLVFTMEVRKAFGQHFIRERWFYPCCCSLFALILWAFQWAECWFCTWIKRIHCTHYTHIHKHSHTCTQLCAWTKSIWL